MIQCVMCGITNRKCPLYRVWMVCLSFCKSKKGKTAAFPKATVCCI